MRPDSKLATLLGIVRRDDRNHLLINTSQAPGTIS
jgi:hypothetical protein